MLRRWESTFTHLAAIILDRLHHIAAQVGILFHEPWLKVLKEAETPSAKDQARSRVKKAKARVRAARKTKARAEQDAAQVCG